MKILNKLKSDRQDLTNNLNENIVSLEKIAFEQQAKIERLQLKVEVIQEAKEQLEKDVFNAEMNLDRKDVEIMNLKHEIERLQEENLKLFHKMHLIQAESIKEVAEFVFSLFPVDKNHTTISRFTIKQKLKEMVGDAE